MRGKRASKKPLKTELITFTNERNFEKFFFFKYRITNETPLAVDKISGNLDLNRRWQLHIESKYEKACQFIGNVFVSDIEKSEAAISLTEICMFVTFWSTYVEQSASKLNLRRLRNSILRKDVNHRDLPPDRLCYDGSRDDLNMHGGLSW